MGSNVAKYEVVELTEKETIKVYNYSDDAIMVKNGDRDKTINKDSCQSVVAQESYDVKFYNGFEMHVLPKVWTINHSYYACHHRGSIYVYTLRCVCTGVQNKTSRNITLYCIGKSRTSRCESIVLPPKSYYQANRLSAIFTDNGDILFLSTNTCITYASTSTIKTSYHKDRDCVVVESINK